jgi:hypothetical protein
MQINVSCGLAQLGPTWTGNFQHVSTPHPSTKTEETASGYTENDVC